MGWRDQSLKGRPRAAAARERAAKGANCLLQPPVCTRPRHEWSFIQLLSPGARAPPLEKRRKVELLLKTCRARRIYIADCHCDGATPTHADAKSAHRPLLIMSRKAFASGGCIDQYVLHFFLLEPIIHEPKQKNGYVSCNTYTYSMQNYAWLVET